MKIDLRSSISLETEDAFNRLWLDYFLRTPFFDAAVFARMYREILNLFNLLKDRSLNISVNMAGKSRAFFVAPNQLAAVKKIFAIRPDELVIIAENDGSLKKLLDAMKTSRGEKFFFIMTEFLQNKNFPFDRLTREGFMLNRDFIAGWLLLSVGKGGKPYNSYQLIKVM